MKDFNTILNGISDPQKRERLSEILRRVKEKFPSLTQEIKWNQPTFCDHGTFIIAFSVAKGHISVAPESATMKAFEKEISNAGYSYTQELFRIRWEDEVDFDLIFKMVARNIEEKKDTTTYWRH